MGACGSTKGAGKWFFPTDSRFAVLLKEDCYGEFALKLAERHDITHVFLVTDSTESFNDMVTGLGRQFTCLQLYRSYIDTFRINLDEPGIRGGMGADALPELAAGEA